MCREVWHLILNISHVSSSCMGHVNRPVSFARRPDSTPDLSFLPKLLRGACKLASVLCREAWQYFPDMLELLEGRYERPSPIQMQLWPVLLSGRDAVGIAQTGTGYSQCIVILGEPVRILTFLLPDACGTS